MAESGKYYWLKLKRDFFKRHDIRIIEAMPNGKDYVLFYLKLLLESIDHNGELRFSDTVPYNENMLSVVTDTNIDVVRAAMKLFIELKMIEVLDDSTIFMREVQRLVGSESKWAEKKRKLRQKEDNVLALSSVCPPSVPEVSGQCPTEKETYSDKEEYKELYIPVVSYLNDKAGTRYKATSEKTKTVIRARAAEGFTLDDFRAVIDNKCRDWLGTEFEKFLRPETLFGTKFEGYLNAKVTSRKTYGANGVEISADAPNDLEGIF